MMQKHLVMTVRAHARCDFALILRTARPESENQHHEVIEPEAPAIRTLTDPDRLAQVVPSWVA